MSGFQNKYNQTMDELIKLRKRNEELEKENMELKKIIEELRKSSFPYGLASEMDRFNLG